MDGSYVVQIVAEKNAELNPQRRSLLLPESPLAPSLGLVLAFALVAVVLLNLKILIWDIRANPK